MNFKDPHHPWWRLTAAARQVSDERDLTAPYGFATRVVALALAQERRMGSLFERFSLRAVGVAGLLALLSLAVNYGALTSATSTVAAVEEDTAVPTNDAVAIVLDLSD